MVGTPKRACLAVAVVLALAPTSPAATLAGVELPDSVKVGDTALVLNGLGLREATFLKVDVYVAGLYLGNKSGDPQAILESDGPKVIHMQFVRKVGRDDITNAWIEGFEKNSASSMDALRARVDQLNGWMEDMSKGDTMRFTWRPDAGLEVSVKGSVRGTVEGTDFARAMFAVFLGEEPPNPGLKKGLLGN